MNHRDYTEEIGAEPRDKIVPWPVALLILASLALGVAWFVWTQPKANEAGPTSSAVASGP